MPAGRGISGSVRGLRPKQVDRLILLAVQKFAPTGRFKRSEAKDYFLAEHGHAVDAHQADGLVDQLERLPGVEGIGGGWHTLPEWIETAARYRRWRLSGGRLNLLDVVVLVQSSLLECGELTPGLQDLVARGKAGLRHIKVDPKAF